MLVFQQPEQVMLQDVLVDGQITSDDRFTTEILLACPCVVTGINNAYANKIISNQQYNQLDIHLTRLNHIYLTYLECIRSLTFTVT